jgi:hypothetical protein
VKESNKETENQKKGEYNKLLFDQVKYGWETSKHLGKIDVRSELNTFFFF